MCWFCRCVLYMLPWYVSNWVGVKWIKHNNSSQIWKTEGDALEERKWKKHWTAGCKESHSLLTFLPDIKKQCQFLQWQFECVYQKHGLPFVCLPVAVIVELIVGRESDEASPSSRQREEDLSGCVFPHLTEEERKGCRWRAGKGRRTTQHGWIKRHASGTFADHSFSHFGVMK